MKKAAAAPKAGAKKPAWKPVSVAAQRAQHAAANKAWKPVPVSVQRARHAAAVARAKHAAAVQRGRKGAPQAWVKRTVKAAGKPKAKTVRKLALGDGMACCAAEALAASLRLTGRLVSDADVLALYRRTAGGPDTGASIVATLEAAAHYGVAGYSVAGFQPVDLAEINNFNNPLILGLELPGPHAVFGDGSGWWSWGELYDPACWPGAVIEEAWAVTWG